MWGVGYVCPIYRMDGAYVGSSGTSVLYIGCMVPKGYTHIILAKFVIPHGTTPLVTNGTQLHYKAQIIQGSIYLFSNKLLLYKCYKAQIAVNRCKFSKFCDSEFSTN